MELEMKGRESDYQTNISKSQKALESMAASLVTKEEEITALHTKVKSLEELETELNNRREERETMEVEIQNVSQKLSQHKLTIQSLVDELKSCKVMNDELKINTKMLEEELHRVETLYEQAKSCADNLAENIDEDRANHLKEIQSLQAELQKALDEKSRSENEVQSLKTTLETSEERTKKLAEFSQKYTMQLRNAIEGGTLDEIKAASGDVTSNLQPATTKISSGVAISSINSNDNISSSSTSGVDGNADDLETNNIQLRQQVSHLESEIHEVLEQVQRLKNSSEELNVSKNEIELKLRESQKTVEALTNARREDKDVRVALQAELSTIKDIVAKQQMETDRESIKLRQNLSEVLQTLSERDVQVEYLNKELDIHKQSNAKLKEEISRLQKELESSVAQVEKLNGFSREIDRQRRIHDSCNTSYDTMLMEFSKSWDERTTRTKDASLSCLSLNGGSIEIPEEGGRDNISSLRVQLRQISRSLQEQDAVHKNETHRFEEEARCSAKRISRQEKEMKSMLKTLDEKISNNSALKKEISRLEDELEKTTVMLEKSTEDHEETIENLQREVSKTTKEQTQKESYLKNLMAKLLEEAKKTMQDMEKLKMSSLKRKERNVRLKDELRNVTGLLEDAKSSIMEVERNHHKMEDDLHAKLHERDNIIRSMEMELASRNNDMSSLKAKISQLSETLNEQENESSREIEKLREEAEKNVSKHTQYESLVKNLQNKTDELEEQVGETEVALKEAKLRADQIYADRKRDIEGYKKTIDSLQQELSEAWASKADVETELDRTVMKLKESQKKVKVLEGNVLSQNQTIAGMNLRVKDLEFSLDTQKFGLEKLDIEASSSANKLCDREIEINRLRDRIDELNLTNVRLEEDNETMKEKLFKSATLVEESIMLTASDLEREKVDKEKYDDKINSLEKELLRAKASKAESESQMKHVINRFREEMDTSTSQTEKHRETSEKLQRQLSVREKKIESLQLKLKQQAEVIETLHTEHSNIIKENVARCSNAYGNPTSKVESLVQQIDHLQNRLKISAMLYEQAKSSIEHMERESDIDRDTYTSEIESLQTKLSKVSKEMKKQETEFGAEIAAIEEACRNLEDDFVVQIHEKDDKISSLEKSLSAEKNNLALFRTKAQKLIVSTEEELRTCQEQMAAMDRDISQREAQIAQLTEEIKILKGGCSRVEPYGNSFNDFINDKYTEAPSTVEYSMQNNDSKALALVVKGDEEELVDDTIGRKKNDVHIKSTNATAGLTGLYDSFKKCNTKHTQRFSAKDDDVNVLSPREMNNQQTVKAAVLKSDISVSDASMSNFSGPVLSYERILTRFQRNLDSSDISTVNVREERTVVNVNQCLYDDTSTVISSLFDENEADMGSSITDVSSGADFAFEEKLRQILGRR
mmetsp:Transcript_36052/g.44103  ORF Transcript_36052/g.44103 Transcript_36052/m.44103 type:complete len:1397 (-) Transcript_36052:432-4622(-)